MTTKEFFAGVAMGIAMMFSGIAIAEWGLWGLWTTLPAGVIMAIRDGIRDGEL